MIIWFTIFRANGAAIGAVGGLLCSINSTPAQRLVGIGLGGFIGSMVGVVIVDKWLI